MKCEVEKWVESIQENTDVLLGPLYIMAAQEQTSDVILVSSYNHFPPALLL